MGRPMKHHLHYLPRPDVPTVRISPAAVDRAAVPPCRRDVVPRAAVA
jgi:hypothetical protein